ncbi:MAG: TonB-dependent receptor [Pseudomonadota bacterium]
MLTYTHMETNNPQLYQLNNTPSQLEALESDGTTVPNWKTNSDSVVLDASYDFGSGFALSNTVYYTDLNVDRFISPENFGSATLKSTDIGNEAKLNYKSDGGRVSAVGGIFFRHLESNDIVNFRGITDYDNEKTGLGVFTETTIELGDRWDVTAGLRYQRDRVERAGVNALAGGGTFSFEETYDTWLPKFAVGYEAAPGVRVGALVSRGSNPGGVSFSFAEGDFVEFEQETVWNYELFSRIEAIDSRLLINANLFFSDFRDAQRFQRTLLESGLEDVIAINADESVSYGLELSADFAVTESLSVSGALGILETEFESFPATLNDLEGNSFEASPEITGNMAFSWDIVEWSTLRASVRYTGDYFSDDFNTPALKINSFVIADASLAFRPADNVEIFLFANNVFDETQPTRLLSRAPNVFANINVPREYGVRVNFEF